MTTPYPIRRSIRLVLLNQRDELLLMRMELQGRRFWCTIGGGIEQGETLCQAARREAREETGFTGADLELGPVIWRCEHLLTIAGTPTLHHEQFMLARTRREQLGRQELTAEENAVVKEFKWWPHAELLSTRELIFPPNLARHLGPVIGGQLPPHAMSIDCS